MPANYRSRKHTLLALLAVCALLGVVPTTLASPLAQADGPVVIVNTAYLNQRTGPGPEYIIQGTHRGGDQLDVVGRTADREWWEVSTQFGVGWVHGEYVLTQGNFQGVPVVSEYGPLALPEAIVFGLPVTVYARPNPGSQVLGEAPSSASFPIMGTSHHLYTNTWYWLIQTSEGNGWVAEDGIAVYGYTNNTPVLSREEAFALPVAPVSSSGRIVPPEPTPVPSAPLAAPVTLPDETSSEETGDTATAPAAAVAPNATPAPPPPPEVYEMRLAGDCYALPLVNYLVHRSPITATGLTCSGSAAGRDAVVLGQAEIGIVVDGACSPAAGGQVATLYNSDGAAHSLSFCTSAAPNSTTRTFLNWLNSEAGDAAVRLYRGVPGSNVPQYAEPN